MKKNNIAFTLLELMITISVIWIIIVWASNINYNNISDKQRLEWFFYKIKTNIETVKNNVLIWKEVRNSLWEVVSSNNWKIELSNSWSWSVDMKYVNDIWADIDYDEYDIIPSKFYSIEILCWRIKEPHSFKPLDPNGVIELNWTNLNFIWVSPCWSIDKLIQFKIKYKNKEKIFTINSISWVIEEQ